MNNFVYALYWCVLYLCVYLCDCVKVCVCVSVELSQRCELDLQLRPYVWRKQTSGRVKLCRDVTVCAASVRTGCGLRLRCLPLSCTR